jgi:hypothetical protein
MGGEGEVEEEGGVQEVSEGLLCGDPIGMPYFWGRNRFSFSSSALISLSFFVVFVVARRDLGR